MQDNFDEEIEKADSDLNHLFAEMDKVYQAFLSATSVFIQNWYSEQAKYLATARSDITNALSVENVSHMKGQIKDLQENADVIARELLQHEGFWKHMRFHGQYESMVDAPKSLHEAIHLIAGRLAVPLAEFGYVSLDPQSSGYVWLEWDESGNRHPPCARPRFPHKLDWSKEMNDLEQEYNRLSFQVDMTESKIRDLKQKKEQSAAADKWDKA